MTDEEFADAFQKLTGNAPFPWQTALYRRFLEDRPDNIPASCNLPTGLGKTMVIAVWLLALATAPGKVPRRLVYVVNRRTVVDQSTREAEKLRGNLAKVPEVERALREMCAIPLEAKDSPLAISTLRGQFADNRAWSADPARPAVICGTVDMIGSRLLFGGYGLGRYDRTHQVGLLGCDALLVHDEAHLTDPFQKLLEAIACEQSREAQADRRLRVLELTATTRHREGRPPPFGLTEKDDGDATVVQRLDAAKTIALHPASDVTAAVIKLAGGHKDTGRAILVFVLTPDQVEQVVNGLAGRDYKIPQKQIASLTGTMRGYNRDRLADEDSVFARFLPDPKVKPNEGTVYLVCTSAGEVGIDISADDLVCDLSTYEGMAQRFGRVNRRGGTDPRTGELRCARIDIVHEPKLETDTPRGERREETRKLLEKLESQFGGSASPRSLRDNLSDREKTAAFGPPVPTLDATDILFDAWALTTITDDLPGRPPVEDWLHGVEPPERPTTAFAWRKEVEVLVPPPDADEAQVTARAKEIEEYLGEYPLKPHERLAEQTARLVQTAKSDASETGRLRHLKEFAKRVPHLPAWLIDVRGRVTLTTVAALAEREFGELVRRTVVLPPTAGGLSAAGMLDGRAASSADRAYDVADHVAAGGSRTRVRTIRGVGDGDDPGAPILGELPDEATWEDRDFRAVAGIPLNETDDGDASRRFVAWVAADALEGEQSRSRQSRFQQNLDDHLRQAGRYGRALAGRLLPDGPERRAVGLAAGWHDLGKDRRVWQLGAGNFGRGKPWAKSGKAGAIRGLEGYRHEFGSLVDLADPGQRFRDELEAEPVEVRELVLHLIAAHHGRGRPHFPAKEASDPGHTEAATAAASRDVPGRFARLQREYGRWGLAYLESLVRAADVMASQRAEGGVA